MASCLLLYGFGREDVVSIGLIEPSEQRDLPARYLHFGWSLQTAKLNNQLRRKVTGLGIIESVTLVLNIDLVNILSGYVTFVREGVSVLIAAFLDSVVSDSSPLGSNEVDNFIMINAHALNTW